jgi:hypothetical protein
MRLQPKKFGTQTLFSPYQEVNAIEINRLAINPTVSHQKT